MLAVTISPPFQYDYTVRPQILRGMMPGSRPEHRSLHKLEKNISFYPRRGDGKPSLIFDGGLILVLISWATESSSLRLPIMASAFFIRLLTSSLEGTESNQEENEERL